MKHLVMITVAFMTTLGQGVIGAATAKPLEHSPGELAWAAWLQQDSGQSDPPPPPRRITTKSLFVFPNLGSDSLPACADGYRPDSMGRCVKVVKVDETAHLEFLLQRLNSQFATETSENQEDLYDYDMDTEPPDNSGPFQFNIPIAMQVQAPKPEDSEGSGDEIILFKKEAPSVVGIPTSLPTSAPEYIPGDMDSKKEEGPISLNKNDTSMSLQNTTDSGTTILISTNGKFENLTSNTAKEKSEIDIIKEIEGVTNATKVNETELDIKQIVTKAVDAAATSILKTLLEEIRVNATASEENMDKHTDSSESSKSKEKDNVGLPLKINEPTTKNSTSGEKILRSDQLVDQIEALKSASSPNVNKTNTEVSPSKFSNPGNPEAILFEIADKKTDDEVVIGNSDYASNKDDPMPEIDFDYEKGLKLRPSNTMDIEDKIRVISRFADVTRNTDENPHVDYDEKKTPSNPEIYPNLPYPHNRYNNFNPIDSAISPSNIIRFPTDTKPVPNNHIGSQEQLLPFEKNRPYYPQKIDYPPSSYRHKTPYWLPQNWNIEQPKDDHNINYWPRMPFVPEYPYVTNVEHSRHPLHYQSIYPNPHESSGRINLRHTSVNHRRGRLNNRDRQTEHEEPILYARGRHPHYRE